MECVSALHYNKRKTNYQIHLIFSERELLPEPIEKTLKDDKEKLHVFDSNGLYLADVHKGVVYVRLSNGVNAVAHSCYDYRMSGKKDDVSFAVTRLDEERGVAEGIITRVIRRNL